MRKIIVTCILLHKVAGSLGDPDFEKDGEHDHHHQGNKELALRQLGREKERNVCFIVNNFLDWVYMIYVRC